MPEPGIVHMSFSGDYGGREKVAVTLFKGMRDAGHSCRLYLIIEERHGADRNKNLLECLGDIQPGCRFFSTRSRFSLRLLFLLKKQLRSDQINLIHCHCYKSLFYAHLLKALGMIQARIVYTLHGLILKPSWNSSLVSLTQRLGLKISDGVIGCSKEILQSSFPKHNRKEAAVIINAIEPEFQSIEQIKSLKKKARKKLVERYGLNSSQPILINVGRLCPQKNFSLYLRMVAKLKEKGSPHASANFLILGNGVLEADLKREASELGVLERVVFTGFETDMKTVFLGADILIQTSFWEGTPMCLLEAQTYALPSVVPMVGGNVDVVENVINGFLYPVEDMEMLIKRLIEYLDNPALGHAHGMSAFNAVRKNYNIENWVSQHIRFYRRICS